MLRRLIHKKVDLTTIMEPRATIQHQLIIKNPCALWSLKPDLAGMAHKVASDPT